MDKKKNVQVQLGHERTAECEGEEGKRTQEPPDLKSVCASDQ